MESVKLWYIGTYGGEAQARPCSPAEFDIIHAHEGQLFVKAEDFDRVTAERNALQLLLNNRDDLDDQLASLEQRRYAEQQARESAERRVEELEGLLAVRDDLLQSVRCLGVFGLLHEDLKNRIKACVRESQSARLRSTLNPTAEAVSHDQ